MEHYLEDLKSVPLPSLFNTHHPTPSNADILSYFFFIFSLRCPCRTLAVVSYSSTLYQASPSTKSVSIALAPSRICIGPSASIFPFQFAFVHMWKKTPPNGQSEARRICGDRRRKPHLKRRSDKPPQAQVLADGGVAVGIFMNLMMRLME